MLIDSINRKNKNYPKVISDKYCFIEDIESFCSNFEARKFHFSKYKTCFQSRFFFFLSSESFFLKYKKNMRIKCSISGNIINF